MHCVDGCEVCDPSIQPNRLEKWKQDDRSFERFCTSRAAFRFPWFHDSNYTGVNFRDYKRVPWDKVKEACEATRNCVFEHNPDFCPVCNLDMRPGGRENESTEVRQDRFRAYLTSHGFAVGN